MDAQPPALEKPTQLPLLDLSKGFSLPAWAVKPSQLKDSYLDVQKDNITAQVIPIGKSPAKIFGRVKELCDQLLEHGSISRQHAAIVHCAQGPTIIDLKSSHGTKLNESKIPPAQPMLLKAGDVIQFGASSRQYICQPSGYEDAYSALKDASKAAANGKDRKRSRSRSPHPHKDEHDDSAKKAKPNSSGQMVRASHILAKHKESRRPSSWREPTITRTIDEAKQRIQDLRDRIVREAADGKQPLTDVFAKYATKESDCSSASRGGDLGPFGRGKMQPEFEHASFTLAVGQLSDPIVSKSGVHIILRTE